MNITPIFSHFVAQDYLHIHNGDMEEYIYELKEKDVGRNVSNIGGWQSNDLDLTNDCFIELIEQITYRVKDLNVSLGFEDTNITVCNGWANVNGKGNFNVPHCHPDCFYSAIYYVKGGENKGDVVFMNPMPYFEGLIYKNKINAYSIYNSTTWMFKPIPNQLIIFPSWLNHYVEPNKTDEDRISIAFNFKLDNKND